MYLTSVLYMTSLLLYRHWAASFGYGNKSISHASSVKSIIICVIRGSFSYMWLSYMDRVVKSTNSSAQKSMS